MLVRELNAIADGLNAARELIALRPPGDSLAHFQLAILDTATRNVAANLAKGDSRFDRQRFLLRSGFYTAHLRGTVLERLEAAPDRANATDARPHPARAGQ
jgi:hypothetical protein